MSRRLRRILVRTLIVLVILAGLLLGAFTWFAFWPLEGSVDDPVSLVPVDVDFVLRTSWKGLKGSGWIQENAVERPVVPEVDEFLRAAREQLIQLEDNERQINEKIPLGLTTFSFEDDVVGGEIVAAGRFCTDQDPDRGPPKWREILVLTRVTWKAKFVSALKHGFVRDNVGPAVTITEEGDGIFKVVVNTMRPSPLSARKMCGQNSVMPPENVWYLLRHKDVLALSNSSSLIGGVADIVESPDETRNYLDRRLVKLDAPPDTIAASVDLQPLRTYMVKTLESFKNSPVSVLKRYLTVTSLAKTNGRLVLPSKDMVRIAADIRYESPQLSDGVRGVYSLGAAPLGASVAHLVPAKDTFGVFLLRTPPLHFLEAIYWEILTDAQRELWHNNLTRINQQVAPEDRYDDIHEFFAEFAAKLGDTAGIAVARLSDTYDEMEFPGFFDPDPMSHPSAKWPGLAMMVRLRQGTRPAELDDYLARKIPLLGAKGEVAKVEYRGFTYRRIAQEIESADDATIKPAYILAQDHFIFASNEDYFRKILDTIADPRKHPPLAADPTYRETMSRLEKEAHLKLFLDLDKLLRIPPDSKPGSQPRGFLWDRRSVWVRDNYAPRNEAVRYQNELMKDHMRRMGRPATGDEKDRIYQQVDLHWDRWLERYHEFEEAYRKHLEGYRRLRSLGLVIRADSRAGRAEGSNLRLNQVFLLKRAAAVD